MKEILSSIFFLVIAAGLIWGWSSWRGNGEEDKNGQPSINALATEAPITVVKTEVPNEEVAPPVVEEKKPEIASNDPAKETLNVRVLNGGAAKGSAAKVQDFLKKNGYAKAAAGSALGDYAGTVVYYLGSNESSATAIQKLLLADYPGATVKLATSSSAENGSASVVVMLGK